MLERQLSVAEWVSALVERLRPQREMALLEAQVLVARALGRSRSWLLAHPEATLTPSQSAWLKRAAEELVKGKPLPYLLGEWEFFGLKFAVSPQTLIPRPETELLVEAALEGCRGRLRQGMQSIRAVDVGTGTGCIAISVAVNQPRTRWVASDFSLEALQVARRNVLAHGVQRRVALAQANLLSPFAQGSFDLICANLPYIPSATLRQLAVYGREPTLALDGGADGLDLIRPLFEQAVFCLAEGGLLLVEIEASQGAAALEIAVEAFPEASIRLRQDYSGQDRLVIVDRQSSP